MANTMQLRGGARIRRTQYLAGFKGSNYPTVAALGEVVEQAAFDGTIADIAAEYPYDAWLHRTLWNDVKICGQCGKPCAFNMSFCNSCGASLAEVALGQSENVFTAFLFGVARAEKGFPLHVSLRRQTPNVLIVSDLLAMSPCHLNAIAAKHFIPDWRYLLTDPPVALQLLDVMEKELWEVTLQFLDDPRYRSVILKPGTTIDDFRGKVLKCFNFPPSQYQLHMQWIAPPLLPFHQYMAEAGNHMHFGRTFPVSYVRAVLELNIRYDVERHTPIEDIIEFFNANGVNYKRMWTEFRDSAISDSEDVANWDPHDFEYLVEDGKAYRFDVSDEIVQKLELVEGVEPVDVQKKDKAALQNYGRPYTDDGKPSGGYLKSPLLPEVGGGGYKEWPGVFAADESGLLYAICGSLCCM